MSKRVSALDAFKEAFKSGRMLVVLLSGFSSGLPLLLIGSTLKLWLKNDGVDLAVIGFFGWVGIPYSLKFLWAPIFDRFTLPFLGRRKGWLFVVQLCLMGALLFMSMCDPKGDISIIAVAAVLTAFFAASQDILVDTYRREILPDEQLGLGSSVYATGYRLGMLIATSLAPVLSSVMPWSVVYQIMAGFMLVGLLTTFFSPEPKTGESPPRNFYETVVLPFLDYFKRADSVMILLFILFFKVGDQIASDILKPFYSDVGFTNLEIGAIAGPVGVWANIAGGLIGGTLILKLGLKKSLWIFGILQALSTAGFVGLNIIGPQWWALAAVIFFETFTGGMGSAAFMGFMAGLTNKKFTATQYALLSSVTVIPMRFLGGYSGVLAKSFGWNAFFGFCALVAIPGLILLTRYDRWNSAE